MEKKKQSSLRFNVKYRAGNFFIIKTVRKMSSKDRAELIKSIEGIDEETRHAISNQIRKGVPFITISTITDTWRVSFCINLAIFREIDAMEYEGDRFTETSEGILRVIISNMFLDTTLICDAECYTDKMKALDAFLARQKKDISKEEDDKILESVKEDEEAKEAINDLAEKISEQEKE